MNKSIGWVVIGSMYSLPYVGWHDSLLFFLHFLEFLFENGDDENSL